jgi:acyl-[acyl-carrier-protein]-phospholipid O-acyltransferase/long-chain-fatty-acid--[acyl-carrier-protein] ligase
MTYKRLLQATRILGSKLMPLALEGRPLGVMLPTSNGAVVTLLAVMSAGRVPAGLCRRPVCRVPPFPP